MSCLKSINIKVLPLYAIGDVVYAKLGGVDKEKEKRWF
jgi:hypothetical protein